MSILNSLTFRGSNKKQYLNDPLLTVNALDTKMEEEEEKKKNRKEEGSKSGKKRTSSMEKENTNHLPPSISSSSSSLSLKVYSGLLTPEEKDPFTASTAYTSSSSSFFLHPSSFSSSSSSTFNEQMEDKKEEERNRFLNPTSSSHLTNQPQEGTPLMTPKPTTTTTTANSLSRSSLSISFIDKEKEKEKEKDKEKEKEKGKKNITFMPPTPPPNLTFSSSSSSASSLKESLEVNEKLVQPKDPLKPYPPSPPHLTSSSSTSSISSLESLSLKKKSQWHSHASIKGSILKSNPSSFFAMHHQIIVLILSVFAYLTRFLYIGWSNKVVWDEAHFGKFASYYIKRTFYFDVHPPLGKTLIGLSGYLAGYNGSFEFESGSTYPSEVKYGYMRMFCAMWGALLVPIAYLTAKQLKMSPWACITAASMVLFDNAYTVISRFILLDSMLLFFTGLSFFCWSKFHTYQVIAPFSTKWWKWLFFLGVSLGLVSSIKWVGFFIVAVVGCYTIESLWDMLGDVMMSQKTYLKHWLARIACLIVVPILVYLTSFALHFAILTHSGPGDAQMSSMFQSNLIGTNLKDSPLEIMYGSEVTLKNAGYGGGLLHSHVQTYPHGSHQQQVTCYHHKDTNNHWKLVKARDEMNIPVPWTSPTEPIRNGDIVRLIHTMTGRNLHSHPVAAPVTKTMYEVSGYGNDTVGDANDHWKVEIVSDLHRGTKASTLHTMATTFRLRHIVSGCLLRSHSVSLPKWGFSQAEVACDKRKHKEGDKNNAWYVEQHWNAHLPPAPNSHFKTSFLQNVLDLNVAMWASNNALTPDPDKEPDGLTSTPLDWPLLFKGIRMCSWGDTDIKYYMMGNPMVWWFGSVSLLGYLLTFVWYQFQHKRHYAFPSNYNRFVFLGKYLVGAWFFHFAPFFIMGRVLYLHHYFPALYFSILLCPFLVDSWFPTSSHLKTLLFLMLNVTIVYTFYLFSPLTFGLNSSASEFANGKQWLEGWNLG